MQLNEEYFKFDESKISDNDFKPVPAGTYTVKVVKAELKDSKAGGKYVNLRLDIIGPTHQGRVLWDKLNIVNHNAGTENSARRNLFIIGGGPVSDTDMLIGREISCSVAVEYSDYSQKEENVIKKYSAIEGSKPTVAPVQQQTGSPGAVRATPPWMKK